MVFLVVACLGLLTLSQAKTLLIETADSADIADDVITTAGEVSEDISADVDPDVGTEEAATSGDYGTGPLGLGLWDMFSGFMNPNKKKSPASSEKPNIRPRPGTGPRPRPETRPRPEIRPRPVMGPGPNIRPRPGTGPRPRPETRPRPEIRPRPGMGPGPGQRPRPAKKPAWVTHKKECNPQSKRPCSPRKLDKE